MGSRVEIIRDQPRITGEIAVDRSCGRAGEMLWACATPNLRQYGGPVLLSEVLLVLMLGLPAPYRDPETTDQRRERFGVIAQAIIDASGRATCTGEFAQPGCRRLWSGQPLDLAVLLLTQAYSESRLARNVHEGECRSYECDPLKSQRTGAIVHRARSLWQMHRTQPISGEWDRMVGADQESTGYAAWAAAKMLSYAYQVCGSIPGAVSRYAGWQRCDWPGAARRIKLFDGLRDRATKLLNAPRRVAGDMVKVRKVRIETR